MDVLFGILTIVFSTQVAEELSAKVLTRQAKVVDLCCGVGISTRALRCAFPNAEAVVGIDTVSLPDLDIISVPLSNGSILNSLLPLCSLPPVFRNDLHGAVPRRPLVGGQASRLAVLQR